MATKNESATRDASHGKVSDGKWFHPARWFRRRGAANTSRTTRADGDAWARRWSQAATAFFNRELAEAEAEELARIDPHTRPEAIARLPHSEKGKQGGEAPDGAAASDAKAAVSDAERSRR